ncbi:LysM peptidoglycan-binding domain-containing protein [bacterium]|nr:MAG: LysM peptidoglycan-binding domain-containing protein [bacterium]
MRLICSLITAALLAGLSTATFAAVPNSNNIYLFPDQYSVLDKYPIIKENFEKSVKYSLENSRRKYLTALIYVQRKDTTKAAEFFSQSLEELNKIASFPGIENNDNFVELSNAIIEDFEYYITDFTKLNADAPLFIIRDKMISDLENNQAITGAEILDLPKNEFITKEAGMPFYGPDSLLIPMDLNDYVQKNIDWLTQTKAKKFFQKWLERSGKWFKMMKSIAKEENMPEEIVYLSMIESALNPNAVSRAKAVGLWQFMRITGKDYGLNENDSYWVDERRDPEKATRAAMHYLKDLYAEFGDWQLSLAAYNCGQGRVRRALRRTGDDDPTFWDIMERLPKETRHYVPLYIATATIAMNPEKYGFDLSNLNMEDEYDYDTYTTFEPVNIDVLAKCANVSEEELQNLNPELIKGCTPPDMQSYELKIPKGSHDLFAKNFEALADSEKQPWVIHTVERYETISKIATKYGVSIDDLVELNDLGSSRDRLVAGSNFKIPISAEKYEEINQSSDRTGTYYAMDGTKDITHTVKRGESLYSISRRYGISLSYLREMNGLSSYQDNLSVGQNLIVARKTVENQTDNEQKSQAIIVRHNVQKGESLGRIAGDYATSIADLQKLNRLDGTNIYPGQILKIRTYDNTAIVKREEVKTVKEETTFHKVRRGETISTIAAKYGMTERELKALNSGKISGNTVFAGSNLKVTNESFGKGSSSAAPKSVKNAPKYYKIRSGETLSAVASKFGVSLQGLMKLNSRLNPTKIRVGQKIRIQ